MAYIRETHGDPFVELLLFFVICALDQVQTVHRVVHGIQRLHRRCAGALSLPVLPLRFLQLDVGGVDEHDLTELAGGGRSDDAAAEPVFVEQGKKSCMVDMGVGKNQKIDL